MSQLGCSPSSARLPWYTPYARAAGPRSKRQRLSHRHDAVPPICLLACTGGSERSIAMKPDDVSTTITQALVHGGSQWPVATLLAFFPAPLHMTLVLHLPHP